MFTVFSEIVRLKKRRRLRALLRGYLRLKNTNRIGLLRQVKGELVDTTFHNSPAGISHYVFGDCAEQADLIVRQMLLQGNGGSKLIRAILYSLGSRASPIVYPLPKEWQAVLRNNDLDVDETRSTLAWYAYVAFCSLRNCLQVLVLIWKSFQKTFSSKLVVSKRYVYFVDLSPGNLPQPDLHGRSYDICSWYATWSGKASEFDAICHNVPGAKKMNVGECSVEYRGLPFDVLYDIRDVAKLVVWCFTAALVSLADLIRGRWWTSFVFAEAAKAKMVQLSSSERLALEYLFHYSGAVYRPMWTYSAEKKGAMVTCYFYSTSEQVKLPNGYVSQRFDWGAASWPRYLVWDKYHAELICRDIDEDANVIIVGPIWFVASSQELPHIPKNAIAVFDVQPHRQSSHFGISTLADYLAYNKSLSTRFLQDIHTVFLENNLIMAVKRKRDIGNRAEKKYTKEISELSLSKNVIMINPQISAIKLIEVCMGAISIPFTSTAHYLREQGIESVYYDPSGWIQKDDRGAHGISILSGIDELRGWVSNLRYSDEEKNAIATYLEKESTSRSV